MSQDFSALRSGPRARPRVGSAAASALALLAAALLPPTAAAQFGPPRPEPIVSPDGSGAPAAAEGVEFEQKLGAQVPMGTGFLSASGEAVSLAELTGGRPVLLVPAYYECPMLCSLVLSGVVSALDAVDLDAGQDYRVVVFSIDPEEGPEAAAEAARRHLRTDQRPAAAEGFHFLTGDEESIRAVADAIGFRYRYLPERDEFAHSAGIVALTPEGTVARTFYGVEYAPRDLRLALVEAADGTIGTPVDEVLLYCFRYDPETGRYSAAILNIVRLGGLFTLAALGLFFLVSWRRDRLRTAEGEV